MLDETGHGQDPAAEEAVRNVEIPILFVLGHAEEAGGDFQLGRRFLRLVFLFVFLLGVGFGARTGAGTLGQGGRGERKEEGHGGDEGLFHR